MSDLFPRMRSYDSRPDTYQHIGKVRRYLGEVVKRLLDRADVHDASKLEPPEVEVFDEATPKLRELVYGSEEYMAQTREMGAALEHHYRLNSHHPEHTDRGIRGMSLLDLIEMVCDWKAASERHTNRPQTPAAPGRPDAPIYDSDFGRSILLNQERFGYGDELRDILTNTAIELGFIASPAVGSPPVLDDFARAAVDEDAFGEGPFGEWGGNVDAENAALAAEEGPESDEMVCDRCGRRHGVVWFAPSDVWNAVMRGGDRGNPDEVPFCCPICFIQLAEERGIRPTGWCVAPEALAADEERKA